MITIQLCMCVCVCIFPIRNSVLWWWKTWEKQILIPFVVVQLPSHARLFVTPRTAGHQAPVPLAIPRSSCPLHRWCHPVISSSDPLCSSCPLSFPAWRSFPLSQLFALGDQTTRASASASVLPVSIQGWFSLRLTGLISFLRDSQESSPTPQFEGISVLVLCLLYCPALTTTRDHWEDHSLDHMDLCWQNDVSTFLCTV